MNHTAFKHSVLRGRKASLAIASYIRDFLIFFNGPTRTTQYLSNMTSFNLCQRLHRLIRKLMASNCRAKQGM